MGMILHFSSSEYKILLLSGPTAPSGNLVPKDLLSFRRRAQLPFAIGKHRNVVINRCSPQVADVHFIPQQNSFLEPFS